MQMSLPKKQAWRENLLLRRLLPASRRSAAARVQLPAAWVTALGIRLESLCSSPGLYVRVVVGKSGSRHGGRGVYRVMLLGH